MEPKLLYRAHNHYHRCLVVVTFELSEERYRATEFEQFMPVRVSTSSAVAIANPITLRITPLTVNQALEMNIIKRSSLPAFSFISPNRAGNIYHISH